jgi:cell shape-determining protein MreC
MINPEMSKESKLWADSDPKYFNNKKNNLVGVKADEYQRLMDFEQEYIEFKAKIQEPAIDQFSYDKIYNENIELKEAVKSLSKVISIL